MSLISEYFNYPMLRRYFHDLKYKTSKMSGAVMYHSEFYNQIIYVRISKNKRKLRKDEVTLYLKRNVRDMKRLMLRLYGKKRGAQLFNSAYKYDIALFENISKKFYRKLSGLNRIEHGGMFFNRHIFHYVFETSRMGSDEIACAIFGRLHTQYNSLINKSLEKLKANSKLKDGRAYGDLKKDLDWKIDIKNNFEKTYYRLLHDTKIVADTRLYREIEYEATGLSNAEIIMPYKMIKDDKNGMEVV